MSLTQHIRQKTKVYQAIAQNLDLNFVKKVIKHHNKRLTRIAHKPVPNTDFKLAGTSVIYGVRDYIGGEKLWKQTVAGKRFDYPERFPVPSRYVAMALMDGKVRNTPKLYIDQKRIAGELQRQLPMDFKSTIDDVAQIVESFRSVFPPSLINPEVVHLNPTFPCSHLVGGADANMILGDTLWDIRTTARTAPLDLDTIIQQIGYWLLDYGNTYELNQVIWYYSRQQCFFTYDLKLFLADSTHQNRVRKDLKNLLINEQYNNQRLINFC